MGGGRTLFRVAATPRPTTWAADDLGRLSGVVATIQVAAPRRRRNTLRRSPLEPAIRVWMCRRDLDLGVSPRLGSNRRVDGRRRGVARGPPPQVYASRYAPLEAAYEAVRGSGGPRPAAPRPTGPPPRDRSRKALARLRAAGSADIVLAHLLELWGLRRCGDAALVGELLRGG